MYRIKGFVNVPNKAMRLVLQGVGDRFDSFYDRPWQLNEFRQTCLVLIGRALEAEKIRATIEAWRSLIPYTLIFNQSHK
ncbi:GTP-binding protein [Leptodesmis sp.]|uniref:GTP-binding protein n=1 Tax=Leptodesmis sp. TaxID=3100501 RepID=UPI0040535888